jgi:hypothetical protein
MVNNPASDAIVQAHADRCSAQAAQAQQWDEALRPYLYKGHGVVQALGQNPIPLGN